MKRLVSLLLLLALCLCALPALGEAAQPCYWQLTQVSVETASSGSVGPCEAATSAVPLDGLSPAEMMDRLDAAHTF